MDKIKVNNQIVSMRKFVKQAKVRAINKLTKEVKMLQDRKGNEMKVAKAKRKAERFLEEITLLKKIKPDYVSKLALSKARNWNEVLEQKTSLLNDRCIALLASYEAVQKEVLKFYSSNANIVPKIPDLIKEWEQKSKLMKGLPKGRKMLDVKKRRIDMNMKTMYSKDKVNSSSVSDQQRDKINNVLSENQESLGLLQNDDIDVNEEKNDDSFQKTDEIKNSQPKDKKMVDMKMRKIDKNMKKMHSKDKFNSSLSALDQQTDKINVLSENQESLKLLQNDDTDVSEEQNDDFFQKTEEIEKNSSLVNSQEDKKQKIVRKQALGINSAESQNEISDVESLENNESNENFEEESSESCSNDQDSTNHSDGKKSEDSDSMCDETDVENKAKSNKKSLPIKDVRSDFHRKKNIKRKLSDDQIPSSSPMKGDCIQSSNFFLNHKKSAKKSSKAIALINLNELEDLDEIPLNKTTEDENEESDEDEQKMLPVKKIDDPFFLGSEELDYTNNDVLSAKLKNHQFVSEYDHRNDRERDMSFSRKERSFPPSNFKRNFQKSSSHSAFTRNESPKFNYDRNKPFKRDQFQSKHHHDRFQSNEKYGFKKDSSRKERTFHNFGRKSQERHSDKPYVRNENSNSFRKDKVVGGKSNDADGKPLHPSWEAKKKQKEMTKTGFQGKRIVFDE